MVIPIFNVVLISDKDENAINDGKHFVLFYFRSSHPEVLWKKVFLEISQILENTCARVSFYKTDIGVFLWTLQNF